MRETTTAAILLAITSFFVAAANAEAQTPPPEVTPPGPSPCLPLVAENPGGPAAPTDLTARWGPLPDAPEASGVLLAWQDNAEDDTCQVVQRKGPGEVDWQGKLYASADAESADDRGFEVTGDYCYRVFAANELGASVSNEACVYVPEVTVHRLPPGAPPPTYPPGVSPPTAVPVASATYPPGAGPSAAPPASATLSPAVGPSPAAPPPGGGGSGLAARSGLSLFTSLLVGLALLAAGAAGWQMLVAGRRR